MFIPIRRCFWPRRRPPKLQTLLPHKTVHNNEVKRSNYKRTLDIDVGSLAEERRKNYVG
jgi:hypothetical protein